jgi:hypothetical protein
MAAVIHGSRRVMQFYDRALKAFAGIQSRWRRTQPRVVMTLLCRNESDIIAEHVTFHLAMGVDFILATDNVSSDRTVEILEHFQKLGKLRLLRAPRYEQAELMTHMARLAAIEHGADWVINSDADEFWWPRQYDLKTTLASLGADVNIVIAKRRNFRPPVSGEGQFYERMIVREQVSEKFRGGRLEPKVAHRAFADVTVGPGNHNAELGGREQRRAPADTIEILHFPVRSYDQWHRKIMEGSAAYDSNPDLPPFVTKGWRYLRENYICNGKLPELYAQLALDHREIDRSPDRANLAVDTRLRDFLRRNCGAPLPDKAA